MGYHRAGFEVVGVDIEPQPHYPFEFIQADALEFIAQHGHEFDVIHASPPCQAYSTLKGLCKKQYPVLIGAVRELIQRTRRPYIIENVMGAKPYLEQPFFLCGSSFGLGVWRHRLFETKPFILLKPPCCHKLFPRPLDVTGTGGPLKGKRKKPGGGISRKPKNMAEAGSAMGIDWMTRSELSQAIPPAYTEWIGWRILETIER